MLKTITPSDMRRVEARAISETGVTGAQLMERAAAQIARAAARLLAGRAGDTGHAKHMGHAKRVLCLCGTGNNGGDGLAAMRIMAAGDESFSGECWVLEGSLSPDAQGQLDRLQAEQPHIGVKRLEGDEPPTLPHAALIIDAMYGTGLSRPLCGMAAALCGRVREARAAGALVLAVDIPSGVDGDTGEARGAAVEADATVSFHRPKQGLYLRDGLQYAGSVIVAPIGIADDIDDADGLLILEPQDLRRLLPPRKRQSHKGSYGRVLLWVGSRGMAGAAAVSALAALRAGAGLVSVACPDDIVDIVQTLCPCATCVPLKMDDIDAAWEALSGALAAADAIGAGCGLGRTLAAGELLARLLSRLGDKPAALDADALNLIAAADGGASAMPLSGNVYITPHPAEAARLLGRDTGDIVRDILASAQALREACGANVVLKGAASVLAAREGMAISPYGTPGMAKGGSGDALTGVLAALLAGRAAGAYSMNDLELIQAACALHGLAGEAAARRHGERGMLATDLCAELGNIGAHCADDCGLNDGVTCSAAMGAGGGYCDSPVVADNGGVRGAMASAPSPLGSTVTVTIDRKLGSAHPKHSNIIYGLNYGYVQEVFAADNDWQDAYIYGVSKPIEFFEGEVVAVIRRLDDAEDKWVVAEKGTRLTPDEVRRATDFQEKFFEIEIDCL